MNDDFDKRVRIEAERLRSRQQDEIQVYCALLSAVDAQPNQDKMNGAALRAIIAVEVLYRMRRGDNTLIHDFTSGAPTWDERTCNACGWVTDDENPYTGALDPNRFCPGSPKVEEE